MNELAERIIGRAETIFLAAVRAEGLRLCTNADLTLMARRALTASALFEHVVGEEVVEVVDAAEATS